MVLHCSPPPPHDDSPRSPRPRWDPWLKRATLDKGYAAPAGPVPEWGFVPFNDLLEDVADEMQGMSWQELAGMPPPPKPGSVADTGGGGSASGIHPSWGG